MNRLGILSADTLLVARHSRHFTRHSPRFFVFSLALLSFTASAQTTPAAATATQAGAQIALRVDLTDAPRKILHADETLAVASGPLTLVYPKWIPGEHGPTGPIDAQAGFIVVARGGSACPAGDAARVKWERDKVEMYAYHLTVPAGCTSLDIKTDFLATAAATGFTAGASTSENLALLSWNTLVLYPYTPGMNAANISVTPSLILPSAWQFGTALNSAPGGVPPCAAAAAAGTCQSIRFEPVSLEQLIDSPVLAGKYFKEIPLAPEVTPKHYLDMAGDGPEDIALSNEHIKAFTQLVRETGALYQSRHYGSYHFLVTLSDSVAHFGLEHHQSSDDRVAARTFIDDNEFILAGDLLPHEFTHSWNGKYRRPAGLATPNYQVPMEGDLLWVYEGLTQYLGDVLATRCGIWTPEQYRGMLALSAANLDNRPGRTWRDLQDTATMAQVLYTTGGGWDNWRRKTDFYAEGELLWLDVDTTIRKLTDGKKSLDDFVALFHGLGGNTPPKVVPYTFNDIVAALDSVAPNAWAYFLRQRLDSNQPHAPLGGIETSGYKLTYTSMPNPWSAMADTESGTIDFWFSVGFHVNSVGVVGDVLKDGPADKAGLAPSMKLVAVNGRTFTPTLLKTAIYDAQGDGPNVELIVENTGFYKVLKIAYHGGERYPVLQAIPGAPDRLADILKPRTP